MEMDWVPPCSDRPGSSAIYLPGARPPSEAPTSNVPPDDLYLEGIQRASFLPAIDLLNRHTQVVQLGGERDYRRMILEQAEVYHTPLGRATDQALLADFRRLANTEPEGPGDLYINGRAMPFRLRAEDMVWFDFEALCGPPRSQNDYIELARCHQTVFMSNIPVMGASRDDRTRRFLRPHRMVEGEFREPAAPGSAAGRGTRRPHGVGRALQRPEPHLQLPEGDGSPDPTERVPCLPSDS